MEKIGRYQVLGELGRGAMGVVYRAQDPAIGRIIAIKTIRLSDLTEDNERERLRDRLFREAQSAGILSHPNIVTIYDIAEENGMAFIFMEFVNGPALEKLLTSQEPPDNEKVINILRQTASALDYAHKKGIVHRDIKPANIMIHDDGQAKITDFGVAKILSQQMTQAGTMMGTPNYMSPEQVQGHAVDGRADQFALAVIAYEILTGEKPFVADYLPTLLYKIVREDPVAPQRLNPTLNPQVETVIRKALSKAPEDRYATCTEFIGALRVALGPKGWQPLAQGTSQNMPTVTATASEPPPAAIEAAPQTGPAARLAARAAAEEAGERNPLVRGLVWVLVGIGVVGLVLLGTQKYLFNSSASGPPPTETASTSAQPGQTPAPEQTAPQKPSPMKEDSADHTAQKELPGDATAETAKPEAAKPAAKAPEEAQQPQQPAHETPQTIPPAIPSTPQKPGGDHAVQFVTAPAGAKITIDKNATCTSPCFLSLTTGRHVADVQLEGYKSYPKILDVPKDSDVFIQLSKAAGSLSITSTPAGASIAINGQDQNKTTPALLQLAPGKYHVRVTRNGVNADFDVEIGDGTFVHRDVNF